MILISISTSFSQNLKGKLEVKIEGLENDSGFVRVHLYNYERRENFPKHTENCYKRAIEKISKNKAIVIFDELPYGTYCLSTHHDENSNESMDVSFLGLPVEGWGISNNVKLFLRLPKFDECSFIINSPFTSITVNMKY
jgi:uncharacterized protein (DUF2141 family)